MKTSNTKVVVWLLCLLLTALPFSSHVYAKAMTESSDTMPCHQEHAANQPSLDEHCPDSGFNLNCDCCDQAAPPGLIIEKDLQHLLLFVSEITKDLSLPHIELQPHTPPLPTAETELHLKLILRLDGRLVFI